MSVTAVVGAQWGDEGKGRIVDYLAQRADMVIRFQGGDNAGHTVVNDAGTFQLHLLPSGIFNPKTRCILGTGVVVNPDRLIEEMAAVEAAGVDTSNLWISERCHVVLPYHPLQDALEEQRRQGAERIGTTKRGIGPTYADKSARQGIRMGDLIRPDYLRARLELVLQHKNRTLREFDQPPVSLEILMEKAATWAEALGDRIKDTLPMIRGAVRADKNILLEGQLGVMRDLDWGIYPYVTSSNPLTGGACAGAGLPPSAIHGVVGVVKAYSTAVGAGPFPVELLDEVGERLREVGNEYGATTGRPRRCGWFDGVAIRQATWLNGFTTIAVTKLDVLDVFEEIKICVAYKLGGETIDRLPYTSELDAVEPVYETFEGWLSSTRDATTWQELPKNARRFLRRISELTGVEIGFISVGPERERLVVLDG